MLSVELAKRLRSSGLVWKPSRFDHFHIPDRNLDHERFVIADLSIDVQRLASGIAAITFNGAVEWSLDYILTQDVVWMPTETQLRELLGDRLVRMERIADGHRVTVEHDGTEESFDAASAEDAYALAVLASLERSNDTFVPPPS